MGSGPGRSLLLNGHIDVVPADSPARWSSPPFVPRREGPFMFGRGAGDMKCGFAMGALAIRALLSVDPEAIAGPLTFLAVIEEECSGNGALSAARDGILADAAVLLEPTDLNLLVGGLGVLWCDIEVDGVSAARRTRRTRRRIPSTCSCGCWLDCEPGPQAWQTSHPDAGHARGRLPVQPQSRRDPRG